MKNDKQMKNDGIYNVRDFGAVGVAVPGRILKLEVLQHVDWFYPKTDYTVYELREGAELDSLGIQRAIDAAHADGGGTVVVPPGDYLIGPIRLRSNIELHLSPGARLWGSPVLEEPETSPVTARAGQSPTLFSPVAPRISRSPVVARLAVKGHISLFHGSTVNGRGRCIGPRK